jgi:hypothetical protein
MDYNILINDICDQINASLYMLKDCIDRCPEKEWNEKHNDYPFSQVVFHTLFDLDLISCNSETQLKNQQFHKDNMHYFDGYEELNEKRPDHYYEKAFIEKYYQHCTIKVLNITKEIDVNIILTPNMDIYKSMTIHRRLINGIRHIQHHSAQLGLRLQYISGIEMNWIGRVDK